MNRLSEMLHKGNDSNSYFFDYILNIEQIIRVYCFDLYFVVYRKHYICNLHQQSHRQMNPLNYQIPEMIFFLLNFNVRS